MSTAGLTCERHAAATTLRCSKCDKPICPRCAVRSPVGMRCPSCSVGLPVPRIRRRLWPVVAVVVAAMVLFWVVFHLVGREGQPSRPAAADAPVVTGFRSIVRPDLGYAVDVPAGWFPAPDDSPTTTSYVASRTVVGSLRVTVGQDDSPLADHVNRLIVELRSQGGTNFSQMSLQISGQTAIKLDYRFPIVPNGPPFSSHTSYVVKRDTSVFSFQLATTDPVGERPLFAHIASSMRLL